MPDRSAPRPRTRRVPSRATARALVARAAQPIQAFLATEAAGGALLLLAALLALGWANSPWSAAYERIIEASTTIRFAGAALDVDVHHVVNDGLMAIFFFVVGLEITREVRTGELRDRRAAAVPAIAAIGGMVVPALLYLVLNAGTAAASGWGVPMATDIAFAVGVLTLAARSAPPGLRSFLLSLAIVDDIGAIVVIAVVYSSGIEPIPLLVAAAIVALLVAHRRARRWRVSVHLALGLALWVAVAASGVHATIAGVLLGLLTPTTSGPDDGASPLVRLEERFHPWTSYAIVPAFAFANAGIHLSASAFADALTSPVTLGVLLGLVVGKVVGISLATWIAVRSGLGRLPEGVGWRGIVGAAAVAGIGFTVALFVAELAFADPVIADRARVGILLASVVSGAIGFGVLRRVRA